MQKKLIALAVAGLVSGPVLAQSNIQIYGVADAYMQYGDVMGDDAMGIESNGLSGSRLGFRGEEDLGSGLKAVFVLEQGFSIDNGQSAGITGDDWDQGGDDVFTRQAYVGLKGNFGQVALGRQYAPGYFTAEYDALVNAPAASPMSLLSNSAGLTITPNAAARWNNAVTYNGTFQSVSLAGIYSAGNQETDYKGGPDNGDDDRYGVSLKYDNGPLKIGGIYQAVKFTGYGDVNGTYTDLGIDETQKEWLIGASYNFGMATLAGSYQQGRDVAGVNGLDVDLWQVGVIVPVGAGNIHVAYAQADVDKVTLDVGGLPINLLEKDIKPKAFTVAYTHALSKRTTGYLGYTKVDYDDLLWREAEVLGYDLNGHDGDEKVDDTDLFYVGVNHKF